MPARHAVVGQCASAQKQGECEAAAPRLEKAASPANLKQYMVLLMLWCKGVHTCEAPAVSSKITSTLGSKKAKQQPNPSHASTASVPSPQSQPCAPSPPTTCCTQVRLQISHLQRTAPQPAIFCDDPVPPTSSTPTCTASPSAPDCAFYVVARLVSGGEPLTLESQTTYVDASPQGCLWGQQIGFCVKVRGTSVTVCYSLSQAIVHGSLQGHNASPPRKQGPVFWQH